MLRGRGGPRGGHIYRMADVGAKNNAHSLAIKDFQYGEDDFDDWVIRFEAAVGLAHGTDDKDAKAEYCKRWLPLKLDETARSISANLDVTRAWDLIKVDLSKLFVDPQEKYNWFAGRDPIVWDGKESFHSLATRIRKRVEKYNHGGNVEKECFMWFRLALGLEYRKAIDIGCGEKWDLAEAMNIAGRLRLADGDAAASTAAAAAAPNGKSVTFTGAAMSDDRLKSLEMAVQGMSLRLSNMEEEATKAKETRSRDASSDRSKFQERSHSRGRDDRGSLERYRRDSPRDDRRYSPRDDRRRSERYRSYDSRDYSRERSRRDSYERRDRDRRGGYGYSPRRPSYDRGSPGFRRYDRDDYRRRQYSDERRGRDDSWGRGDRRWSRDRYESRGRSRDDRPYSSRDSSNYGDRRRDEQSGTVAVRDNKPRNREEEDRFRSLDLGKQIDLVAAALAQQRLQADEQPEN